MSNQQLSQSFLHLLQSGSSIDIDGTFLRNFENNLDLESDLVLDIAYSEGGELYVYQINQEDIENAQLGDDQITWTVGNHLIQFFDLEPVKSSKTGFSVRKCVRAQAIVDSEFVYQVDKKDYDEAVSESGSSSEAIDLLRSEGKMSMYHSSTILDETVMEFEVSVDLE